MGREKGCNLPITTTLLSTDPSGTITDIQSDGLGSYLDGVDADTSFLTTNGYNGMSGAIGSSARSTRPLGGSA